MDRLQGVASLTIRQNREWGETVTGFETRNRYSIFDAQQQEILRAQEEAGPVWQRWFLQSARPFRMTVTGLLGEPVFHLERPFSFFLARMSVYGEDGRLLGRLRQRFHPFKRITEVTGPLGEDLFRLTGTLWHPWTLVVRREGREIGRLAKRWSGLGQEMFTRADNFTVTFPPEFDGGRKALLLAAVILMDFTQFENRK